MAEAQEELNGILSAPDMSHVPIVIIANKQDLPSKFNFSRYLLNSKTCLFIRCNENFGYNPTIRYESITR